MLADMYSAVDGSITFKLMESILGIAIICLFSRFFDKINKVDFREKLKDMEINDYALYSGLRLLAFAVLVGLVFSG